MGALGQEPLQPLQRLWDRIRPRDADDVEAVLARGMGERGFQLIGQKSRSA